MNKVSSKLKFLIIFLSLMLSSCGYISDKAPETSNVFAMKSCTIDVNKLGEIFKTDQREQIRCLQENFINFTKYVRSREQGSISESELNAFIRKFFEGQSETIIKGLSLIFQLNMLLLKDEADRISRGNISPLFNLLVKVNQEAIVITQILKEISVLKNQEKFWELREKFTDSVYRFSEFTVEIIKNSPGLQKKLNIKEFIIEASKKIGDSQIDPETIDSMIFLKRILVAGEKEVISTSELSFLISKLPKLLTLSFDLYYARESNFKTNTEESRFYLDKIRELYSIIEFNQKEFDLFSVDQLLRLAQDFYKDSDVKRFKPSIIALKSHFIGGASELFSLNDFKKFLDIGHDFFERNYFNTVTYNAYAKTMQKTIPITQLQRLDLPDQYNVFTESRIYDLHADFQNIALNFKYFRSKNEGVSRYSSGIYRNLTGFLEVSTINWLVTKIIKSYGDPTPGGINQISYDGLKLFLYDLKPILDELKLWPQDGNTFTRNAILLADLFQNKSNGDSKINVLEGTEYIQMILTSLSITDKLSTDMFRRCDGGLNIKDPLYETDCFNPNYFHTLTRRYGRFLPRLDLYVNPYSTDSEEINNFLIGVEGFARDNPDPNILINKRESNMITGAFINIESFFIRFDLNNDNILDFPEIISAFKIYKQAIIILTKLKPSDENYAQSIFLYMLSKMQIPPNGSWIDNAAFYSFHVCVSNSFCRDTFMDKIEAKRINIGKLLYYMVNQNPTDQNIGKKL